MKHSAIGLFATWPELCAPLSWNERTNQTNPWIRSKIHLTMTVLTARMPWFIKQTFAFNIIKNKCNIFTQLASKQTQFFSVSSDMKTWPTHHNIASRSLFCIRPIILKRVSKTNRPSSSISAHITVNLQPTLARTDKHCVHACSAHVRLVLNVVTVSVHLLCKKQRTHITQCQWRLPRWLSSIQEHLESVAQPTWVPARTR